MSEKKRVEFRGSWTLAFVPVVIFLIFCIYYFVINKAFEMYALVMGAFVGLLIGALLTKKDSYGRYWEAVYDGAKESVPVVVLLFEIGMFSALVKACGVSNGFVWLGQKLGIGGGLFTAFTFVAVSVIATATGSSIGTMFTCFPIFYPAGVLMGSNPMFLAGAIVAGGVFGDNLAPISDTTIISAGTQEYKDGRIADVGGCVASRLKYSLVGGAISFVIYWLLGGGGSVGAGGAEYLAGTSPLPLVMLLDVVVMLLVAVKTGDIYKATTVGIVLGALIAGLITPAQIISVQDGTPTGFLTDGINNMMSTTVLVIAVYGIMGVLNAAGAMDRITNGIATSKLGNTVRGTEIAMMLGVSLTTLFFGGVTSASMATFGKIQNELGKKAGLHPYRRANLLDGFANSLPVCVPFLSCFAFIGAMCSQGYDFVAPLSSTQVAGGMIYNFALFFVLLFSVLTGWGRKYEGKDGKPVKEKPED